MLVITCSPPPGFEVYRCGFREEIRDGRRVRVGLAWPAGVTRLENDALTPAQIDALNATPADESRFTRSPIRLS
jgi:hypothetical protein